MKIKIRFILMLLLAMCCFSVANSNVCIAYASEETTGEKVCCTATVEDDFIDDRVIVVFNQQESFKFKD